MGGCEWEDDGRAPQSSQGGTMEPCTFSGGIRYSADAATNNDDDNDDNNDDDDDHDSGKDDATGNADNILCKTK